MEVERGYQDLLRTTRKIEEIMNLKVVDGAWDVGGSGERWHERDTDIIMRLKMTSMYWILDTPTNVYPHLKKSMLDNAPPQGGAPFGNAMPNRPRASENTARESPVFASSRISKASKSSKKPPKIPKFSTVSMNIHRIPEGMDMNDPNFEQTMRGQMVESSELPDEEPVDPQYEENARKLNLKPIGPSADLKLSFTANPVYCGLASFSMLTDFDPNGIALCNWHKSIWPSALLYMYCSKTQLSRSPVRKWTISPSCMWRVCSLAITPYRPMSSSFVLVLHSGCR